MKKLLLILSITLLSLSCSEDSSQESNQDFRYKLIFNSNGSGAIIGDKSNKVVKRIHTDINTFIATFNYSFNPNSRNFYFPAKSTTSNEIVLHKANALSILNSDEYYYQTTEIPVLAENELFVAAFVNWDEDIFVLYKNDPDSAMFLKKISSGQQEYVQNITALYGIVDASVFPLPSINKAVITDSYFPSGGAGVVLDLSNKDNYQTFALPDNLNLFNILNDGNTIYMVHRSNSSDEFMDLDGNIVSFADRLIGRSALGYDVVEGLVEYIDRGDGRNEAGRIDISSGNIEFGGLEGEPGFHVSRLFFFEK